MKTKNKKLAIIAASVFAVAAIVCTVGVCFNSSLFEEEIKKTDSLFVSYDYPVAADLQQMVESADYIVVGKYTGLNSTWNMARNPNNIAEEDSESYVEGRLYDFEIETVIKGSTDEETILVNHRYSEIRTITESNAVTDDEGIIIKEATESRDVSFEVSDPLFIEPETGEEYILFLNKDEDFGDYYASIEPFSIEITDGEAVLKSNLLNGNSAVTQNAKRSDSGEIAVTVDVGAVSIDDEITGKSSEEIIEEIEGMIF